MPTITQALLMEHQVFRTVFDQIERALAQAGSVREVKFLAKVAERLLSGHAKKEENLAYSALDHVLAEKGRLNRLHQDHHEIDEHFKLIQRTSGLAEAKELLQLALAATREHFRREEDIVFPFLERVLRPETLESLGKTGASTPTTPAPEAARNRVTA